MVGSTIASMIAIESIKIVLSAAAIGPCGSRIFIDRSSLRRPLRFGSDGRVSSTNGACLAALPAKFDRNRNIKPENPFPHKPQFVDATAEQVHVSAHRDRIVTAIISLVIPNDCAIGGKSYRRILVTEEVRRRSLLICINDG